jgi:hypothetical protein
VQTSVTIFAGRTPAETSFCRCRYRKVGSEGLIAECIEKALPSLLSSVKALPNVIAVVRPAGMNLNAFSLLFKESSLIQQ